MTSGRAHSPRTTQREPLTTGWTFCGTEPSAISAPAELAAHALQWQSAVVPGTVASSLRALQAWSLDAAPRDFDAHDWWYRTRFNCASPAPREQTVLHFAGLATVADVWLNGQLVLHSDNMFRAYEIDIGALLQADNELVIRFHSLNAQLGVKRPRPRWKVPMLINQQLRWFRTTLLGRTPGWSPPAAAVGPWRGVYLERRTQWQIPDVQIRATLQDGKGIVNVTGKLNSIDGAPLPRHGTLHVQRGEQHQRAALHWPVDNTSFAATLEIANPELWWPHTHGTPTLYDVALELHDAEPASSATHFELGRIGFRNIRVDSSQGDFQVIVNDVPVFCRGACWTPLDVVSLTNEAKHLQRSFDQVCAAGMNMLRVGGTMVYESDAFLDLCDERGVLLWQDLMFANMDYPDSDAGFIDNIKVELQQQLTRLNRHACLAVICGNSEGEQQAAMFGATRDRWQPQLFHEIIPSWIAQSHSKVAYWPSSAHGGSFPHQNNAGTTSYYGVGAYLRPLEDARRSELRFASECLAFANVPEEVTLERMPHGLGSKVHQPQWKARVPRDLGAGWDFDDVRDYYLTLLFGKDVLELRYGDHDRYLELSRATVGEVMATTFAEWRRKRSTCNGALIWFLRDFWPGAGWGVIDSQGVAKSAFYYLKRALQPVAISLSNEGCNGVYAHVVNETAQPLHATLSVALYRHGEVLVTQRQHALDVDARGTLELPLMDWFEGFIDLNYAYRFGPAGHDLIVATLQDAQSTTLSEHFLFNQAAASEFDLGMTATARLLENGDGELVVQTRRFARAVTLRCPGFEADDQYFNIAPGSSRTLLLKRSGTANGLLGSLMGTVHAMNAHTITKIGTAA